MSRARKSTVPLSIATDVLELQLPLLVSKETLLAWKAVMDFGNHELHMRYNVTVPLIPTTNWESALSFCAEFYFLSECMPNTCDINGAGFVGAWKAKEGVG